MSEPFQRTLAPFYCPYCGEETLRPAAQPAGAWHCDSCLRIFELHFHGVSTYRESEAATW